MTSHEVLRDAESETGAVGTAGDEGVENRVANLGQHTRPVVLELNRSDESIAFRSHTDVDRSTRAENEPR